jgi:hypothetical protein
MLATNLPLPSRAALRCGFSRSMQHRDSQRQQNANADVAEEWGFGR